MSGAFVRHLFRELHWRIKMHNITSNKPLKAIVLLIAAASLSYGNLALAQRTGTTLAAYKTIDICSVDTSTWRYSGVVAVYNEGVVDTVGLIIDDVIQSKVGTSWVDKYPALHLEGGVIPANGSYTEAIKFPYSVDRAALDGDIRNVASVSITNHSGSLGTPKGPQPKATYAGTVKPCVTTPASTGCVHSQGYWGNKPNVIWPVGFNRDDLFFLSGKTWQQIMDIPPKGGNGYYVLAYQYIAAVLNSSSGASVPTGVQDTLTLSSNWLSANIPGACTNSACGMQKDWGKVLETYNLGNYPNGPEHCAE